MKRHPIRRKSKYNPYTLEIRNDKYILKFIDSRQIKQIVEIDETIYQLFNQFELDDIKEMHRFERHIEHSEIYEETLYHRSLNKEVSLETAVIIKLMLDNLYKTINSLPSLQKTRIKRYFFKEMTLEEIAKLEGVTEQAISKSIKKSLLKIKKYII